MGKGGTSDSESTRREFTRSSGSPVARCSFTAPPRFSTTPVTAITNSLLSFPAFSNPASSMLPFSKISCMIPERSLRSTNTIPPLLRAFCTHPINVILLPVISFVTSAQRQVLCSPFILSAIACVSFFVIYLLYSVAEKFYKFRIAFRGQLFFLEFLILLHNGKVHLYAAASLLFILFQNREKFVRRHVFLYEEGFLLLGSRNLVSSFQKKHDDPFKTNGKTAGRSVLAGKFADHLIVP